LIKPVDGQANRKHFKEIRMEGQILGQSLHVMDFSAASRTAQHSRGRIECRDMIGYV
jgi:hypothetical protein